MTAAGATGGPYRRAGSLEEATRLLAEAGPDAKLVAGGQSLLLLLRQGFVDPGSVIDIGSVPALVGIEPHDDGIEIGAATTYAAIGEHDALDEYGGLRDAVSVIADRQVRNLGTVGGAVSHADPSLDIVPPLRCLDATVHLASSDGTRELPLEGFVVDHMTTDLRGNELVRAIAIPAMSPRSGSAYEKHATVHGGWATVGAAAHVTLTPDTRRFHDVRVAFAAVADTAVRAPSIETALRGEPLTHDAVRDAADHATHDIDPLGDHAGSAGYKERVAAGLAARALRRAAERAGGSI